MLQVLQRPEATLYAQGGRISRTGTQYYTSRWNAASLPIVYKIENTKSPNNGEDTIDQFSNVYNVSGFARFDLVGASYEVYIIGEKVSITGSDLYDGIYEVKEVVAGEYVLLDCAYIGTDAGNIQRYYDNYTTIIRVYAGVPPSHPNYAHDPMSFIGIYKISPDPTNVATVDIRDLIKQKISQNYDLESTALPNDMDAWTAFFIEYAEAYDYYPSGEPVTFTSEFQTDYIEGCSDVIIENPEFTSDITGWSQTADGDTDAWAWDSGAKAERGGVGYFFGVTNYIYQGGLNLKSGVAYSGNIQGEIFQATADKFWTHEVYAGNASPDYKVFSTSLDTPSMSFDYDFDFTLPEDCTTLWYRFKFGDTSGPGGFVKLTMFNIDNLSGGDSACTAYGFASNSTRQFFDLVKNERSLYGGNMAEYVQNYNNEVLLSKFLTRFETPTVFAGYRYDISTILPQSTIDLPSTSQGLLLRVNTTDYPIDNQGDGVYRLTLDDKVTSDSIVQIIRKQVVDDVEQILYVSEAKTMLYNDVCSNNPLYLSWINSLGGWEYWLFKARKTYELTVDEYSKVQRNIYSSWPTGFDSETENDKISIRSWYVTTVRSQYITKEQADILAEIIHSIRVQQYFDGDEKITVEVVSDSMKKYEDGQKMVSIEFDIAYPMIQVQSQ